MLKGKKILLGITGSIAAYKSLYLLRMLIKAGAEVRVVMTPAARDFVTPLSLSTLSKHPVQTELFANDARSRLSQRPAAILAIVLQLSGARRNRSAQRPSIT